MCIAAWVWQFHPVYQLLLLLNRDEYHDRPTKPVEWWGEESNKKILGGRDEFAGGTWLGCSKDGRMAFLTNFREPDPRSGTRSRGELPVRFLKSTRSPYEFAAEIVNEVEQYDGFNLILIDLCSNDMVYVSNRPKGESVSIQEVPPGLHVLSNAKLDTHWPKAQRLGKNFNEILMRHENREIRAEEMINELMRDNEKADRNMLPITGCSPDWEFELSSIFIDTYTEKGRYWTRSMAAVSAKTSGEVSFYERYLESCAWKEHVVHFNIPRPQSTDTTAKSPIERPI